MTHVLKECYRVVKSDGRIAYNIPHVAKIDNSKSFPILDFSEIMKCCGFNIREIIYWFKTKGEEQTYQNNTAWGSWRSASNPHLRGLVEPIIIANKGSWKKESGSKISDITEEEFKSWTKSAWFINGEQNRDHPAPFPIDIPLRLIKLYTFVGDTILDPFVGSGTTLRACEFLGRNGIGIDLNPEYKNCLTNKNLVLSEINKNVYMIKKRKSLFED
jgi:site-specific DNA-methyltransferase (adenine-specific)